MKEKFRIGQWVVGKVDIRKSEGEIIDIKGNELCIGIYGGGWTWVDKSEVRVLPPSEFYGDFAPKRNYSQDTTTA